MSFLVVSDFVAVKVKAFKIFNQKEIAGAMNSVSEAMSVCVKVIHLAFCIARSAQCA
jgi:hypothetical protein